MKDIKYTRLELIIEIKKSILEAKNAISVNKVLLGLTKELAPDLNAELERSIKSNTDFLRFCKECLQMVKDGKFDEKLQEITPD